MKKLLILFLASHILFSGPLMVLAENLPDPQEEQEPPQDPEPQPEPQPDPNEEDDQEQEEEKPDPFAIKINEILADPVEPEAEGEFIELYNSGEMTIDLSGWVLDDEVLDDNHNYVFDNPNLNYILEPGHYLTFYRPETAITLNNDGDAVYLFDEKMDEIDYHVFESTSVGRPWGRDVNDLEKWILLPAPSPNAENAFINNPPVADIHVQGGTGGMKLNVTGENSSDPDGDKLTYLWEFEPGVFNEAENPVTYEFKGAGNKNVKLTVTDEFGLFDEAILPFIAANGQQEEETQQEEEIEQEEEEADQENEVSENDVQDNENQTYPKLSLINEFLPDPEGADGEGEWVELYNSSDKSIDLSGWYLDDEEGASAPFKIPEKTIFNSKSYLLFKGPQFSLSLKNSADVVRLLDPHKAESERIDYSESKEGLSYAKNHENKFVWTATPTPKAENKFPLPPKPYLKGVIRFDSVLPNPEGTDTGKEKILLKNMSGETIDLMGWKIANSSSEKELSSVSISAHAKKELDSADFGLTLKNTDETLKLLDPTGQLIDEISWKASSDQWLFNPNVLQNGMTITVKEVADGDTFKVTVEDKSLTVRLLGVDTPETLHPFKPVEHYGNQASDYLKNLLSGKQVKLNFEEKKIDAYGRVLAYVYLNDQFVNAEVIKQGYGYAYTKYPFQFLNEFLAHQNEAKAAGRGLWADPEVVAEIEKTIQEDLAKPEEENSQTLLSLSDNVDKHIPEDREENEEAGESDSDESPKHSTTQSSTAAAESDSLACHSENLKIHSFLAYPKKGVNEEFIKIVNNGKEVVCLIGWQLDDATDGGSKPYKIKEGEIKPGEVMEFGKADTKLSLNNSNDCATLINPKGEVADQICYGKTKEGEVLTHESSKTNASSKESSSTTSQKNSSSKTATTDTPKHGFNRESSAYRSELVNNSFLGKILGMDEVEMMLVVELEDGKIMLVSYAHSLFDMKMLKALIKLEKMLMFEVYQGADFAHLISVYDPDNLKGVASERSSAWMILLFIPLSALAVLIWKYRATILTLPLFRWLKTN